MEFLHSCPEFERMLVRAGIVLIKYWFSLSDEEQERRFQARMKDPTKRWNLSAMDVQSRSRWAEYSRAKDEMFAVTDIKQAPWYVVNAEDKKCARLNVIRHLLSLIPYEDLTPEPIKLPALDKTKYIRPPIERSELHPNGVPALEEMARTMWETAASHALSEVEGAVQRVKRAEKIFLRAESRSRPRSFTSPGSRGRLSPT